MTSDALKKILEHVRQTAMLQSTMSMLEWDQNTGLPPSAAEYRADQLTLLAGMVHQRRVDPELGHWLDELIATVADQDPTSPPAVIARCMKREFDRCRKLPQRLVEELSYATSIGQQVWVESKLGDDYPRFMPQLTRIVELKRQEADCLASPGQSRYDVMLDSYEEGATTQEIRQIFLRLRESLVPMIQRASERSAKLGPSVLEGRFAIEPQERFSKWVAGQIGFDFQRGRLDQTEHPFCTTLGPHDHRILTRYSQESFSTGLYGVLHEAGHGMYEQGLDPQWYGTPVGSAASLGVHESQSRLWENLVGLASPFWTWAYPHLLEVFPSEFRDVAPSRLLADLNRVQASLIRIEADEVTYNMHILIRFELEEQLMSQELQVAQLPEAWNDKYKNFLGIAPSDDRTGVLQDVHWSAGLIGYFPTYTLGNIYSAQLYSAADRQLGGLDRQLERGEFRPLLEWLRDKVHRHGQTYLPMELIQRATGEPVDSRYLVNHLNSKCSQDRILL
jgi:carboxypeptidase Taq